MKIFKPDEALRHGKLLITALVLSLLITACGSDISDVSPEPAPSLPNTSTEQMFENPDSNSEAPKESTPDAAPAIPSQQGIISNQAESISISSVPEYSGSPYVTLNDNIPNLNPTAKDAHGFETYASLDYLGRCGTAYASVGPETMPSEERGSISDVTPSGWEQEAYDFVDGQYIYNRCHLIGFQLTGENANEKNLITGTRYMNVEGMLPFENMIADYVKETSNHVLYRVTPIYDGSGLVAKGVEMEAISVEDQGEDIQFHVFCYNVQPGVIIDYQTGKNWAADSQSLTEGKEEINSNSSGSTSATSAEQSYILNKSSKKFHYPDCSSVNSMKESNKEVFHGNRDELINKGYDPCKRCDP